MQIAKGLDRRVDDSPCAFEGRDAVGVGNGLATAGNNLVNHGLRRADIRAGAVGRSAKVVDHDLGSESGEQQRMLAADATSATSDGGNTALQPAHQATACL